MAAPKLTSKQKEELKAGIAARETYSELAEKFKVSTATITHYVNNHAEEIAGLQKKHDAKYHNRGFRSRDKRLEELELLAERHKKMLFREPDLAKDTNDLGGFYEKEVKLSANGDKVEYYIYNSPLVREYRAILEQIAKETGQLPNKIEVSGIDGNPIAIAVKAYMSISPDDWDDIQVTHSDDILMLE